MSIITVISLILPNVVIILVDKDIDLHLNRTLKSHKNDSSY